MGKTLQLLSLAFKSRPEFWDRVRAILEVRMESCWVAKPSYEQTELRELLARISSATGKDLLSHTEEPAIGLVKGQVSEKQATIGDRGPFKAIHSADFNLAMTCYAVCRAFRPAVVVETGVAYGVTSSFILQALEQNQTGHLHSVDLPPLGKDGDSFVGAFIPPALKHRWTLHRGASRRVLPALLQSVGKVDFFIHDSLHTYANMKFEFEAVTPYLGTSAVVVADDIADNDSFGEWCRGRALAVHGVAAEPQKRGNFFGIAVTGAGR